MRLAPTFLALTLAGCPAVDDGAGAGEGEGEGEPACFIGDSREAPEIELIGIDHDANFVPLEDGGELPLFAHVEGGYVGHISVRARNVSCQVVLSAQAFDDVCATPPRVISREGRPVILEEGADGFGVPPPETSTASIVSFVNLPFCPSLAASRDVDGERWLVRLTVTQAPPALRETTVEIGVVPACAEDFESCRCWCDADFVLEQPDDQQCPTIHDDDVPGACD